ncbi:DUF2264 domain-containing protein [Isoptericola sp. BMS4]|uniref:DUF2264 domain-containing protein n=1 Tax=Isoptericola sp. BMS4 TaxID=2527875 RepID=UPI0014236991|nr:DUF2264 domain-containing protein [Isoptericola sp. BMS4]
MNTVDTPRVRTRADLAALADRMLRAARSHGSPGHARITLPGAPGGYGTDVDGLEGFARTLLVAGFRLAGARGQDPDHLAEWYAAGFDAGTDPAAPERWVRPSEHGQAKVEAASLALVLDMTREQIWDRLDGGVQERVVDYLAEVVGDRTYPANNWLWFRVVVETFLRSVGGPWSRDDVEEDLARHDAYYAGDGWYADGSTRAFDHYSGWAMQLYPVLWARMTGAEDLAAARRETDVARLDRYLRDAVRLVGADGSPLVEGRSLIYRFASAAPFWAGALARVPSTSPGLLRHAAMSQVDHFVSRGAPDADGLLSIGWYGPWRPMAQSYSGTGSPYWAAKGLLGLALEDDDPAWTAPAQPLPVEESDTLTAVAPAGWIVSGTAADGLVRVVNHGTDHGREGEPGSDSPLYARFGYSTATFPMLDRESWSAPLDQAVVLLDERSRPTHRTGMWSTTPRIEGEGGDAVGIAASGGTVHRVDEDETRGLGIGHALGVPGTPRRVGDLRVVSLVRGCWEVRLVRVESLAPGDGDDVPVLRVGGWPVSGDDAAPADAAVPGAVAAAAGGTTSTLAPVLGGWRSGIAERHDATPLGPTAVPWLSQPVETGAWSGVLLTLSGTVGADAPARADLDGTVVRVAWPDGRTTRHDLATEMS